MMPKEYRNKLIATGALLLGVLLFTIVDGLVRYAPENNTEKPNTEMVTDTEMDE